MAGTNTGNQIDHAVVKRRNITVIKDIRSYRGADIDSDHILLTVKCRINLHGLKQDNGKKRNMS